MKTYQSHKIVKAVKCSEINESTSDNDCEAPEELPEDFFFLQADDGKRYKVKGNFFARGEPDGEFYIVEYEGGYRSWSPAEPFEKGYDECAVLGDVRGERCN